MSQLDAIQRAAKKKPKMSENVRKLPRMDVLAVSVARIASALSAMASIVDVMSEALQVNDIALWSGSSTVEVPDQILLEALCHHGPSTIFGYCNCFSAQLE